jgi:uncharacterized protein (DUF697 family)
MQEPEVNLQNDVKETSTKEQTAQEIIKKYMWWSAGAGLIPFPYLDLSAVVGVQIKMLADMSKAYEVEFSANRIKAVVGALLGGLGTEGLSHNFIMRWAKTIPFVGFFVNLSYPVFAAATTYAVGKVFIQHFESGGTFLDFKPEKVKGYFADLFKEGQKIASGLKPKKA